jgi:hypothetical protein
VPPGTEAYEVRTPVTGWTMSGSIVRADGSALVPMSLPSAAL